jgi:hypothetical protein
LSKGSEHNDLGVCQLWCGTQDVEHFETAYTWHHNVRNYEVGSVLLSHRKSFFSVLRSYDVVALSAQSRLIDFPEVVVVFDEK